MNAPQDLPQQPVPMFSPKHFPVYMDYSATTPIDPRVVDKMLPYLREQFGNAASRSHAYGWAAEEAVEWARSEIALLVHADPREIVFTSGATESINLAKLILSVAPLVNTISLGSACTSSAISERAHSTASSAAQPYA